MSQPMSARNHVGAETHAPSALHVRPVAVSEVRALAELHATALPHGFFVRLGRRFLSAYYRGFVESPHAVALRVLDGTRPVGHLVGVLDGAAHWNWVLRRHGLRLALSGALALVRRPRLALPFIRRRAARYVRALRRHAAPGRLHPEIHTDQRPRRTAVLSHVAVEPRAAGRGAGTRLVAEFMEQACRAGATRAELVTRADGRGAGPFYERMGWSPTGAVSEADGTVFAGYYVDLPPGA